MLSEQKHLHFLVHLIQSITGQILLHSKWKVLIMQLSNNSSAAEIWIWAHPRVWKNIWAKYVVYVTLFILNFSDLDAEESSDEQSQYNEEEGLMNEENDSDAKPGDCYVFVCVWRRVWLKCI